MKRLSIAVFCIAAAGIFAACSAPGGKVVDMYAVNDAGIGQKVGHITARDTHEGLLLQADITVPLAEGGRTHGFHIHENPSCQNTAADGKTGAALAAGGHFDPEKTGHHHGPQGGGHKGDLPFLTSNPDGTIKQNILAPGLTLADIAGRSFMIHAGGDNYSDTPLPLGGGGARIACGVIN